MSGHASLPDLMGRGSNTVSSLIHATAPIGSNVERGCARSTDLVAVITLLPRGSEMTTTSLENIKYTIFQK